MVLFGCDSKNNESNVRKIKCSEINKVDSLIAQIAHQREIYTPMRGIDSRYRFLVLKSLQTQKDTIIGFNGVLFTVVSDSEKYMAGTITIDKANFNTDSTKVDVMLGYYMESGFKVNTIEVTFKIDTNSCNWIVEKSSTSIH